MSSEIATWGMIHAKVSSFPVPVAGRENESLTRSEILSKEGVEVSENYGNNECVMLDDIESFQDISLGYIESSGVLHHVVSLMNTPLVSSSWLKWLYDSELKVVAILKRYPQFMQTTNISYTMEFSPINDLWAKMPCIAEFGSCLLYHQPVKMDENTCYMAFNILPQTIKTGNTVRISIKALDGSLSIIDETPTVYFTFKE